MSRSWSPIVIMEFGLDAANIGTSVVITPRSAACGRVGYPVSSTVMAGWYVGAAVLLLAIRDRPVDPIGD